TSSPRIVRGQSFRMFVITAPMTRGRRSLATVSTSGSSGIASRLEPPNERRDVFRAGYVRQERAEHAPLVDHAFVRAPALGTALAVGRGSRADHEVVRSATPAEDPLAIQDDRPAADEREPGTGGSRDVGGPLHEIRMRRDVVATDTPRDL